MPTERNDSSDARRAALRAQLKSRTPETAEDRQNGADTRSASSGISQAWRLSSEFLAGVLVGFALGYGFDWFFGTTPWGIISFVLLGFGAAVLNVLRASSQIAPSRFNLESVEAETDDR